MMARLVGIILGVILATSGYVIADLGDLGAGRKISISDLSSHTVRSWAGRR